MQWLVESLRQHPEVALFLVLALGNVILAAGRLADRPVYRAGLNPNRRGVSETNFCETNIGDREE